jgi:hypothetical protein
MAQAVDIFVLYKIIKALITPFDETPAFELGLIDANGKRLKKASTKEEKKAMQFFDRFVFNLKRIMHKVGLKSKFSNMAAALFLLKEEQAYADGTFNYTDDEILSEVKNIMEELQMKSNKTLEQLTEEIANASGAAVAGTGDDPVHWKSNKSLKIGQKGTKKRQGRSLSAVGFIERMKRLAVEKEKKRLEAEAKKLREQE